MSDYTPEQDELLAVIETAHREAWTDATEYADAPHSIRAAVVRWLAEHDREVKATERRRIMRKVRSVLGDSGAFGFLGEFEGVLDSIEHEVSK